VQWSSVPYTVCSTATRAVRHAAHATTHLSVLPTVVRVLLVTASTSTDMEGVTYVAVLHRGTLILCVRIYVQGVPGTHECGLYVD
jgi:hypothetical protein